MLAAAWPQAACLPLDDLSSYSSAWERQPGVRVGDEPLDASTDAGAPADSGATANGADAGLDASSPLVPMPDAGAGEPAADAGEPPAAGDGGPPLDAGGTDAAS
jgi:hypothetical protein